MIAIFKREFKSYFNSVIGYLFVAVLLAFTGVFVTSFNLMGGYAAFEYALESTTIVFLLAVPILAMRSLTEDKRLKTDRLLYSLPIKTGNVIIGKYLAMLAVLLIPTVLLAFYPLILSAFGTINFTSAYACLLAFFLLGAALIAVCMFLSSLADSQIVAALLGFASVLAIYMLQPMAALIPDTTVASLLGLLAIGLVIGVIAYFLTKNVPIACGVGAILVAATLIIYFMNPLQFGGLLPRLLSDLALFERFSIFPYGLVDVSALVLFLCIIRL